jgi:hypothetical protein
MYCMVCIVVRRTPMAIYGMPQLWSAILVGVGKKGQMPSNKPRIDKLEKLGLWGGRWRGLWERHIWGGRSSKWKRGDEQWAHFLLII